MSLVTNSHIGGTMAKYHLSEQTTNINGTIITTYGIIVEDNRIIRTIADISTDKSSVEKLIEKFNKHKLSCCHIDTAIEDFLYDQNID